MTVIDNIAVITEVSEPIRDAESIMDTILSLKYETGAFAFAIDKACFDEAFFRLSSGIAGEVIQKFVSPMQLKRNPHQNFKGTLNHLSQLERNPESPTTT